jgi:hypothetical protein
MSAPRWIFRASGRLAVGAMLWLFALAGAHAETIHVTYSVSLVGLPIGIANLEANLTQSTYTIDAHAKISGLAYLFSRARGASTGRGAIIENRVVPATFATIASNASMTRTIRMSLSANAVTGVDITPPFDDKPDRVPLTEHDKQGVVDPVGAVVVPVPAKGPLVGPASCDRKIPVFDGYTRFDIDLTYVGQRDVSAKGYKGPSLSAQSATCQSPDIAATDLRPSSWPTIRISKCGWRRSPAHMCCCRSVFRPAP